MHPKQIVHSDPEIVSGTPVFVGTRVPAQALLDYLKGGETIGEFLDDFPSVPRQQAIGFMEEAWRCCWRAFRSILYSNQLNSEVSRRSSWRTSVWRTSR